MMDLSLIGSTRYRTFALGAAVSATATLLFLFWVVTGLGGAWTSLCVDDLGQLVAAWVATLVCCVAACRVSTGQATWALFAASSFAWGAGEAVWCYYALLRNRPVPFPSLADVGFLVAVPFAFAALLMAPGGPRSGAARFQGLMDGCIIAMSLLFASWATVLGPLYRSHNGGLLKQTISLAYPMSDVVMVALVVILVARGGRTMRVPLALVMAGVLAFAVADSSFTYLTEVNSYTGGSFLDTGWVLGYLLMGLGALWSLTCPSPHRQSTERSAASLVAPYVPVLVVLAVTGVQLLRGRQMEPVSWIMAMALALLVLGREALGAQERFHQRRKASTSVTEPRPVPSLESVPRWREL